MRIIMTLIWAVLISGVVSYVLTSMAGEPFSILQTLIVAGMFGLVVIVLGGVVLKEE